MQVGGGVSGRSPWYDRNPVSVRINVLLSLIFDGVTDYETLYSTPVNKHAIFMGGVVVVSCLGTGTLIDLRYAIGETTEWSPGDHEFENVIPTESENNEHLMGSFVPNHIYLPYGHSINFLSYVTTSTNSVSVKLEGSLIEFDV